MLGLYAAQRQNDRLALIGGQVTPDGIIFRQSKKGAQPLLVPELSARLAESKKRRADWRVHFAEIIADEVARQPFKVDWWRKVYRGVREAAVGGVVDEVATAEALAAYKAEGKNTEPPTVWKLAPCPSLADFRDQDLRDTAVTWLALAGPPSSRSRRSQGIA